MEKNKSKEGNWTFLKKEKNYYDFKVLIYHIIFYEIQTFLSYHTQNTCTHICTQTYEELYMFKYYTNSVQQII